MSNFRSQGLKLWAKSGSPFGAINWRGLALKVREKLRSQKSRIVLVKKPLDCLQFSEHGLDLVAFRAGPDRKILGQLRHKFFIRHIVGFGAEVGG